MIEDAKPWPDYLPEFGREDLIAIGVIALNYGELESALRNLFAAATGMDPQHLAALFYRMPNDKRKEALAQIISTTEITEKLKEHAVF
jgi:hypothetical protein